MVRCSWPNVGLSGSYGNSPISFPRRRGYKFAAGQMLIAVFLLVYTCVKLKLLFCKDIHSIIIIIIRRRRIRIRKKFAKIQRFDY